MSCHEVAENVWVCRGPKPSDPIVWTLGEVDRIGPRIWATCCNSWRPTEQTWYRESWHHWHGYDRYIRCAPGFGCDLDESKRNGMDLRERM